MASHANAHAAPALVHDPASQASADPPQGVEMSDLNSLASFQTAASPTTAARGHAHEPHDDGHHAATPGAPLMSPSNDSDAVAPIAMSPPATLPDAAIPAASPAPESQIEPATAEGVIFKSPSASDASCVSLILLIPMTGARHPFSIDERYLRRRNVGGIALASGIQESGGSKESHDEPTEPVDPWSISVYQVKELIWRDWRNDWESRPTNPSSIRLIHFGRLLDDKSILRDCRLTETAPNVIHMSVKPAPTDEDDAAADKVRRSSSRRPGRAVSAGNGDEQRSGGCACCIVQ